jgi:hypothetical protein
MKFFHHWVITGIQWMVQWWMVRVHYGFKDLGKHVHSCYQKSYFKKLHITNRMLCLELNYSLSFITIFAFCCWPIIVCCFLVTSCRLVGWHTPPIGCVWMNIVQTLWQQYKLPNPGKDILWTKENVVHPLSSEGVLLSKRNKVSVTPWFCHLH